MDRAEQACYTFANVYPYRGVIMKRVTICLILIAVMVAGCSRDDKAKKPIMEPPPAVLALGNLLYGGDISARTQMGRDIKEAHAEIAELVEQSSAKMGTAYDRMFSANRDFIVAAIDLSSFLALTFSAFSASTRYSLPPIRISQAPFPVSVIFILSRRSFRSSGFTGPLTIALRLFTGKLL